MQQSGEHITQQPFTETYDQTTLKQHTSIQMHHNVFFDVYIPQEPIKQQQYHADLAESLITHIHPENNHYNNLPSAFIIWGNKCNNTSYFNHTTCNSFLKEILKKAYPDVFHEDFFHTALGQADALATYWFDWIATESRYTKQGFFGELTDPKDIRRGDILSVKYLPSAHKFLSGHLMIVADTPRLCKKPRKPFIAHAEQYEVDVFDSSETGHYAKIKIKRKNKTPRYKEYPDTRYSSIPNPKSPKKGQPFHIHSGAGRGTIRLYRNIYTGRLVGYTWSMYGSEKKYVYTATGEIETTRVSTFNATNSLKCIIAARLNPDRLFSASINHHQEIYQDFLHSPQIYNEV